MIIRLAMKEFVHLHVHSDYSVLDGAARISRLVEKAVEYGMPALALTDHGNMFGAIEFYKEAMKHGIKPIIGIEAYITDRMKEKTKGQKIHHLTLLATDNAGLKNLMYLSTMSYLEGFYYKPRIDRELLSKYSEGLVALSGCPKGEVPSALLDGDYDRAAAIASEYADIFGKDRFFLEMQEIGIEENRVINEGILRLSKDLGLDVVATNDIHYIEPDDWFVHDVILCIQTKSKLSDPNRMRYNTHELYFRSAEEMYRLFSDVPQALKNTLKIAEMVDIKIQLDSSKVKLPQFEPPQGYTVDDYLRKLAFEGLKEKMGEIPPHYIERLESELGIISRLGYSAYFLIIWDIVQGARKRGIEVGPGRGSAVGSLVLYAIGISEVDPIEHNLIFERFLNPDRVSPPDVDIDFEDIRRDEVIDYIRKRFGDNNVAQIITFGRMLARAAVRDVARVLDLPYSEADRIAKLIPSSAKMTIEKAVSEVPELKSLVENSEDVRKVIEIARKIEGQVRQVSTHAAGVVISRGTIWNHVPLYKSPDGTISTQFEMKSLEELGMLKVDVLGLRTLTVVKYAEQLVRERHAPNFDIRKIPMDDELAFDLLSRGETVAVFQVESRGFRDLLKRAKPRSVSDLTAIIALYRPGPIQSGMLEDYVARKQGRKAVEYFLPQLKEVLEETYGVVVYQEQVMKIAQIVAGFTASEADLLRRAMGKKKVDVMQENKEKFIRGASENGIPPQVAADLFHKLEKFAGYGFNKSHATAYAVLAYRTAYLKARYPIEFMTANLMTEYGNTDRVAVLVSEARRLGIDVKPPNINLSDANFAIEGDAIRYGLAAVKNVGGAAAEIIVKERKKRGPFKSFYDFLDRILSKKVNKKVIESLIKAGAFDEFDENRARLMEELKLRRGKNGRSASIGMLFDAGAMKKATAKSSDIKWNMDIKMAFEKEALGYYLTTNPLSKYDALINSLSPLTTSSMFKDMMLENNGDYKTYIVGVLSKIKRKKDRQGRPYAILTFVDFDGEYQVTVFADLFNNIASKLEVDKPYIMAARLTADFFGVDDDEHPNVRITIDNIIPVEEMYDRASSLHLHVKLSSLDDAVVDNLIKLLKGKKGKVRLYISIRDNGEILRFRSTGLRVKVDEPLLRRLGEFGMAYRLRFNNSNGG